MAAHNRKQQLCFQRRFCSLAFFSVLLVIALTLFTSNRPVKGVFYQPLNRDADVNEQQWQSLLHQAVVASEDLSEVVVQWNQYGEADFGGKSGWLAKRLSTFDQAGLKIWFGLYSDPLYFESVHSDEATQDQYLAHYFELLLANYNNWRDWLNENKRFVKGVYVPAELSDYDFDTQPKREALKQQLRKVKEAIKEPVMISVYFSGNSSLESLHNWLKDISDLDIKVMVQDGRGTQLLNDATWQKYQMELPCSIAVIKEVFIMGEQKPPTYERLSSKDFASQFNQNHECHAWYAFSLRYFPLPDNPLKLHD
ncbi:DUF4434 domain-containing protein [Vibrio fluvialis]|uniref:DUF4434 domain-containing protein n=1 Tax=Vibrio fluvialis TaxID=676 RepID=UPI001C9BD4DD|nr:DUF4434 domain-containing protein [Vibrio fluvialis]MBY7856840.1 DUF4434 domain-containing protein [Vibrio fluvialis]MBY7901375.1 DUF4434 domain-containing protein [Vibrio fluvialis]MBY7923396.1 DUF4434 domain-containing protein [Vibrio fluvialis]MBY7940406.1 DUF4434 domain-containing protein [Vibrio fluvialis]